MSSRVWCVIACHDPDEDLLRTCVSAVASDVSGIILTNSGSTCLLDSLGSVMKSDTEFCELSLPEHMWWSASTNRGVMAAFERGATHVLLLNPDVECGPGVVAELLDAISAGADVAASVVSPTDDSTKVWWAGSRWSRVFLKLAAPVANVRPGDDLSSLGEFPFPTDDFHGRGVMISRRVFEVAGLYDEFSFPQYGADNDFAFRCARLGLHAVVVPHAVAWLDTSHSGMVSSSRLSRRPLEVFLRLTSRRHGEQARVIPLVFTRHLGATIGIPSAILSLARSVVAILVRGGRTNVNNTPDLASCPETSLPVDNPWSDGADIPP